MIGFNKFYVDSRYNIDRIKNQWDLTLQQLLSQYPTPDTRGKPKEMFVYRTA